MKYLVFLLLFLSSFIGFSQFIENKVIVNEKLTVGTSDLPTGNSVFEVGDTLGGVKFPKFTQTQINNLSLSSADTALILYNLTDSVYQFYDGDTWENFGGSGVDSSIYSYDGVLTGDRTVDLNENQLTFDLGTSASRLVDKGFNIDASGINHSSPNTIVFNVQGVSQPIFYLTHKGELISTSESSLIANLRNSTNDKGLYLDQTSSTFRGTSLNISFEGNSSQPYILNTNVSSSSQLRWYKNSSTLEHRIRTGTSNSSVSFFEGGISSNGFLIGSSSKVSSEDISLQGYTLIQGGGSTSATTSLEIQNSSGSVSIETLDDLTVIMPNLPTSSAGLPSGALWNNSGVVNVVP